MAFAVVGGALGGWALGGSMLGATIGGGSLLGAGLGATAGGLLSGGGSSGGSGATTLDPATLGQNSLATQIALAGPQYEATAKYAPQYAGLYNQTLNQQIFGNFDSGAFEAAHPGYLQSYQEQQAAGQLQGWTPQQFAAAYAGLPANDPSLTQYSSGGMLDIYKSTTPQLGQIQASANTAQRQADITDVANLGSQATAAYRASNPELTTAMNNLTANANANAAQAAPQVGLATANAGNLGAASQAGVTQAQWNPIGSANQAGITNAQAAQAGYTQSGVRDAQAAQAGVSQAQAAQAAVTQAGVRDAQTALAGVTNARASSASGGPLAGMLTGDAARSLNSVSPIQQQLNAQAQQLLSQGGNLSAQELQRVQQDTRGAYEARGLYDSNAAIGAEVLNTDAARRQRLLENQQQAGAIDAASQAQVQANRGYAQGVQSQAQNLNLYNTGAANTASLQNAAAANTVGLQNAQALTNTSLANAGAWNQASQYNAGQANALAQYNAGLQTNVNLANSGAANTAALQNAQALTNTNLANSGAWNQASQYNAGQANALGQYNAGLQTNVNLANSGAANTAALQNAQAQNQYGLAQYQLQGNMALQNANAANTASLQNAAAQNQYGLAQYQTNADMSRYNTGLDYQTQLANAGLQMQNQAQGTQGLYNLAGLTASQAQDPYQMVLGRSGAVNQSSGLIGQAAGANTGAPTFDPFNSSIMNIYAGNQANQTAASIAAGNNASAQNAGLMNMFGNLGSAAIGASMFCWVAREVYRGEGTRWLQFRRWLMQGSEDGLLAWYLTHGPRAAQLVRADAALRRQVRAFMDARILEVESQPLAA